ncbi:MAG: hypothetical protein A4E32_01552 [Methanomassiliicoccales archaeon PtaU1.Bin124]|nr:MAG: hypothetical protein A4E32_01552 [Methanomassiliicoccales archaeon PtaU1.Bin124]
MAKAPEERRAASEFGREKAIVHDGVRYATSILPYSSHHLVRVVELGDNSLVEGDVFGRKVEMGVEAVITGRMFAQDWATVGMRSKVCGDLISHGSVVLEEETKVGDETVSNIIATDIKLGRKCVVTGNLIARRSIEIGEDSIIRGAVICLAGPIVLGARCSVHAAMSHGPLTIGAGARVHDQMIWSHQKIDGGDVRLDNITPDKQHIRTWEGMELNLNADRMSPPKEAESKADDRWYKSMREIFTHRPLE